MITAALAESDCHKVANSQQIGDPSGDASCRNDTLEATNQKSAEADSDCEAEPTYFLGVELLADGFGESFGFEPFPALRRDGVSGRGRELLFVYPQCHRPDPLLLCS